MARIAGVRLIGDRVDDGEGHVERLVLAERVDECGGDIRHQLHIGLVDRLEALDGGTIERHAVGECILEELAGGNREVLLNADEIGEANGDVLNALLVDQGLDVCFGFECSQGTAPFM